MNPTSLRASRASRLTCWISAIANSGGGKPGTLGLLVEVKRPGQRL
jgi:hypothetical protein